MRNSAAGAPGLRPSRGLQLSVVAAAYLALVLCMWGPHNPCSGLYSETVFPFDSENTSTWKGFIFKRDPIRIFTCSFYHLGYVLAEGLGIGGSFVPYQVVYALLWWARGLLFFLILRAFLPRHAPFCFIAGALAVTHASDRALNWVGQMNQFGYIFWMLLAYYLLIQAYLGTTWKRALLFLAPALFFQFMSLWSYESQVPLMLVAPLLLLFLPQSPLRNFRWLAGSWYLVLAIYMAQTVSRYLNPSRHSYQETVLRQDWSVLSLASDWIFNIWSSLAFWSWEGSAAGTTALLFPLLAAVVIFCAGWYLTGERGGHDCGAGKLPSRYTLGILAGLGLGLLSLSFPVYLLLDSARSLWRTQFLSGLGAGLTLAALIALAAVQISWERLQRMVGLGLTAAIVFCGARAAVTLGQSHRDSWERHREAMAQVLQVAPRVKPGTLIILLNVPQGPERDPFIGDNMWFDVALRLAYPKIPVAGLYFYECGAAAPGSHLKLYADIWKWDAAGFPPLVQKTSLEHTLLIAYSPEGRPEVAREWPGFLLVEPSAAKRYDPQKVIEAGTASPRALRRYGQ